jgi:hypothetical protein
MLEKCLPERGVRNRSKYHLKGLGGRQTEEPEIGFGREGVILEFILIST